MLAVDVLQDAGFVVVEAEHGEAALKHLQTKAENVHALFTDVHMLGEVNGVEFVRKASKCWPWLRLLVALGHARLTQADLPEGCRFLRKPYEMEHLVRHISELTTY